MEASLLKQLRPFAYLTPAELNMLARVVDQFEAPAGTALVIPGDYGYEFMLVEAGYGSTWCARRDDR